MATNEYSVNDWIKDFIPTASPFQPDSIRYETGYADQEAHLASLPDNTVWTQIWDWDIDVALITNGYTPFGSTKLDVQGYFVTEKPWEDITLVHGSNPQVDPEVLPVSFNLEDTLPFESHLEAAQAGNVDACYNVAGLYLERGDRPSAKLWYQRAVEAGDIDAMYNLGLLHHEDGETMDALKVWLRSGNLGDQKSIHALSVTYDELGDTDASTLWKSRLSDAQ
jgi:hypothetical protein